MNARVPPSSWQGLAQRLTWRAYAVLTWALQPLLRLKLRHRARAEPLYGSAIDERFGFYSRATPQEAGQWVWVHAVSLGETRAAAALIAALRESMPGMRLLLTHGTATGRAQGQALLRPGDLQVWAPWDTTAAVQRFLERFAPRVGLLIETEVWPVCVRLCQARGIPLCLVNARLSERSLQAALRWAWLARPAYAGLHTVWAQSEADAQRLRVLGARVAGVMGNFKFDLSPDAAQQAQGRAWRAQSPRPVVLFASSREGEEALWLQQRHLGATQVQWLLVPRHPQRFDEVEALLRAGGLSVARRSQWGTAPPRGADVWLGDSLGEMAMYFGLADVALLGGSFAPLGGQNLIEAAACGCPVVMGPHTFNFSQAAQLARDAGAAFEVPDLAAALRQVASLLAQPEQLRLAREAALALGSAHQGAALRTAQAVALIGPVGR